MRRRTFIRSLLAGAGAIAVLREHAAAAATEPKPLITVTEPKRLTVKEWAELNRIESWTPLEASLVPNPPSIAAAKIFVDHDRGVASLFIAFKESEPWSYIGPVERFTVETKSTVPRKLSERQPRILFFDEPDQFATPDRFAKIRYR